MPKKQPTSKNSNKGDSKKKGNEPVQRGFQPGSPRRSGKPPKSGTGETKPKKS